ncbi:hypothetical protein GQ44DRAFT_623108 [Phaeosphaeriaceae sp. PMI808]|nr:hypothetical protein GQ44DRAFT_623108 [Phaeosphaeriaceae sp. PMI808]
MSTGERDRSYRVSGLPHDASFEDSVNILSALFDTDSHKTEPDVHSLGLDPYRFGRTVSKVATATFAQIPETLCEGNNWTFSVDSAAYRPGSATKFPVTIDTHFLGFTPLNSVKDDEDHKIDFIAVSGLSSHPFGSWKHRRGQFMWLRDALACNPQGARVLLYGYDTGLVQSESFQDIDDIGNKLSFGIRRIRSPQPGEINSEPRPIVFIAHSLGGLVAIYRMASTDPVNFQSIYGLLFFGVPNRGIEISHWLPIVNNQPNENLIRNLAPGSIYLRNLQQRFSIDSCPPGPRHDELGFNQNHSDLPKFSGPWDHDYRNVEIFLDEFRREAVWAIQARFGNEGMKTCFLCEDIRARSHIPLIVLNKTPVAKFININWQYNLL